MVHLTSAGAMAEQRVRMTTLDEREVAELLGYRLLHDRTLARVPGVTVQQQFQRVTRFIRERQARREAHALLMAYMAEIGWPDRLVERSVDQAA